MSTILTLGLLVLSLSPLQRVAADANGMDMSMDGAMSLTSGNMLSYLHFTPGDIVWFQGWVPRSTRTMVGACIGLFLLAVFDRWLAACRGLIEAQWHQDAQRLLQKKAGMAEPRPTLDTRTSASSVSSISKGKADASVSSSGVRSLDNAGDKNAPSSPSQRVSLSFMPGYDVPRGIVHAAQSALEFAFMFIVMTYQVSFIISLVVGLGVGETLFGRYSTPAHLY